MTIAPQHTKLVGLAALTLVCATVAASFGWYDTSAELSSNKFVTVYGQSIELYNKGLYSYDWDFRAAILRGSDAVMLFFLLPAMLVCLFYFCWRPLPSILLLTGFLAVLCYNAASLAFGVHYNKIFLLYLLFFSLSFFTLLMALWQSYQHLKNLQISLSSRRWVAVFLAIASLSPLVWLIEHIDVAISGNFPKSVAHYTTDVTTLLDVGLILPCVLLASYWLWHQQTLGYLLGSVLLTVLACIGVVVAGQSLMQWSEGISLAGSEIWLFVMPFLLLSVLASLALVVILQAVAQAAAQTLEPPVK